MTMTDNGAVRRQIGARENPRGGRWWRTVRALLLALAVGVLPVAASAQPAASGDAAAPAAKVDPAALKQLLETLQTPAQRDRLAAQIKALVALEEGRKAPQTPPGIGGRLLDSLSSGLGWTADAMDALARRLANPAPLWHWAREQVTDPAQRALWRNTAFYVAVVLAGGILAWLATGLLLARARRRVLGRDAPGWLRRIRVAGERLALDLVPIVAFVAAALVLAGWVHPPPALRLILLAIVNASALSLLATALTRMALSPMAPSLRLVPLQDATAAYLYIWLRRMIVVVVSGYILLQTAVLLHMWQSAYVVVAELVGLFIVGLVSVFVLQNREPVAAWIRGGASASADDRAGEIAAAEEGAARPAAPTTTGSLLPAALRARLASVWHIAAIFYIAAIYLTWALAIPGGTFYLLSATVETAVVVAALFLLETQIGRLFGGTLMVEAGILAHYPMVARRAGYYLPLLRAVAVWALRILAAIVVLAAWQINIPSLLVTPVGSVVIGHAAGVAVILVVAVLVWEVAGGSISSYLQRTDEEGHALLRSTRARTLLPLIRNVLLITVSVLATLAVLAELGVNIAPLLAGAGVVGLAIGIGAQSLVKDIITGAFILFEDTINIGDVVDLNGQRGRIEGLTVRTVRLRDLTGSVHTIPFGSVTSVTNLTKEFSYYMLDVGVAYRENTDEVVAVLRDIDEGMRQDEKYADDILEPIDIMGVDRFADSAVYVRARTKTKPLRQWVVGREFNRRIKLKFDELGIEIPFPHTTVYFGEGKDHTAPPAHLELRRGARAPTAAAPLRETGG